MGFKKTVLKKTVLKTMITLSLLLCLVVAGAVFLLNQQMEKYLTQPLAIQSDQLFTVPSGGRLDNVLHSMSEQGWIKASPLSSWVRRLHPELAGLKAGTFELHVGDNLQQALGDLIHGQEHQFSITFVEGSRFSEWREALAKAPQLTHQTASMEETEIAKALGIDHSKLEGLFLAETYHYTAGMSDLDILRRAHAKLDTVLEQAWQSRQEKLPLTSKYEALTLASIIEKETALASERKRVASVFINRLNIKMRLQTDPTVIYGMGEKYTGNIKRSDLREPTAYNTYVINGLPPTPIAMPGADAIQAALNPETSQYLYFVASGKGGHVFSRTLNEHNRAVRAYLQQLKR